MEKFNRIIKEGDTLEAVYKEDKDALYQWKMVGDGVHSQPMLLTPILTLIEQRVTEAAQRYSKQIESLPFDQALKIVQQAIDDPLFKQFFEQEITGSYPVGVLRHEDMKT